QANHHAWIFGRNKGRRISARELVNFPREGEPHSALERTWIDSSVFRRTRRTSRSRWWKHARLLCVAGRYHRRQGSAGHGARANHQLEFRKTYFMSLQPRAAPVGGD